MPLFGRRTRAEKTADLVRSTVEETLKATSPTVTRATRGATQHVIDALPTNEDGSQRSQADVAEMQARVGSPGMQAVALPRLGAFNNQMGPGTPYLPTPLDPVDPVTGRAMPRRYEYQVAINLDLTRRRVPWTVLRSLADDCDIIHRCAEIRTSEIVGLNWDFAVTDHAITRIMADNNVSSSEAQKLGRQEFAEDIDKQKAFWENPDQNADVGFSEWMTEALDQHFTYDGLAVYPRFNLGGALIGLEVIDAPTIKILRDNRGGTPMPPYPAYQQVLWGFPRGEFHASDGVPEENQFRTDQLSYFVRNRKTSTPYGFSTVEESMLSAIIYMERQAWMRGEYTQASMPMSWMKTDLKASEGFTPQQLSQWEKVLNDDLAGQTAERLRVKILPDGFDPSPMQQVAERYTAAYDEYLIKQVGSKWGIAPTQLGVIPTTGLSGRGQQEGEQDQADTMSKRPTEEWLADVINSMSRRYLGTSRDTGITFNDPQTSDDDLAVAQAQAQRVNSGIRTINAVAIENGDPSFDMPEADEPFVMTSNGPVFLRGLLEQQMKEQEAPSLLRDPFAAPPLPPGAAPATPQPPDAAPPLRTDGGDNDDRATEAAKFVRFVNNRKRKGQSWRPFEFDVIDSDTAGELNKLASEGDTEDLMDAVMAEVLKKKTPEPLGDSRPGPGGEREKPLVDYYVDRIKSAMGLGLSAQQIASRWLALGISKATVPEDLSNPAAGGDSSQLAAARAFVTSLQDQLSSLAGRTGIGARLSVLQRQIDELGGMVDEMYRESYLAGAKSGLDKLDAAGIDAASTDLSDAVVSVDWGEWTPGNPTVAASLGDTTGEGGLATLLSRSGVTIKGITDTTMDDLAKVLADGVGSGDSAKTLADKVQTVIASPTRAMAIARTEINRAMTAGDLQTYRDAGLSQFDWLDSPGACPICIAKVEDNPHELGDDGPPAHPNCRCTTLPVMN